MKRCAGSRQSPAGRAARSRPPTRSLAASLPRRCGEATVPGPHGAASRSRSTRARSATVRGESFADVLRGARLPARAGALLSDGPAAPLEPRASSRSCSASARSPPTASQRPFGYREHARRCYERRCRPSRTRGSTRTRKASTRASPTCAPARPSIGSPARQPRRGLPEDSLLVVLTFYTMLSNNDSYERGQGVMHATLPPALYDVPDAVDVALRSPRARRDAGRSDRRLRAAADSGPRRRRPARASARRARPRPRVEPPLLGPASNQWAVDATRGAAAARIVANDPHLSLRLPNIFYRVELEWPDHALRGVSIPGLPGVLIGASDDCRVGRDRQQRRPERLGRRRASIRAIPAATGHRTAPSRSTMRVAEIAVAGRASERIETRSHALGSRRGGGLARPAARAARDVARAAGARSRHRGPRSRDRRRERERDSSRAGPDRR